MLHKVSWINIQLALADGARIKDSEERKKDKENQKPRKMSNEEMREFFNNRNAMRRKH